jgi:molybdopterin synthase catalytic subunit
VITINVRLFAGLRELAGASSVAVEVPEGATLAMVKQRIEEAHPRTRELMPTVVCAVNEEYVPGDHRVRAGDTVALIPPVSGGAPAAGDGLFAVTADPLDAAALVDAVRRDEAGAVALFYGVVRNENLGRRVQYLEYDAYPEMAVKKLREVADEVCARYPVTGVGILHRTGRLEIGETSLLVAVSSGHRKEAFEACHYAVDRVKQIVPVWKKEVWEDGSAWIEGNVPELGMRERSEE